MLVSVSQVSVAQKDTVVRQLAALLHVLDGDVQVRALQGRSHLRYRWTHRLVYGPHASGGSIVLLCLRSTVLRFSVRGPSAPLPGSTLVRLLRNQLLGEKSDYLLFRVLRVDTVCE